MFTQHNNPLEYCNSTHHAIACELLNLYVSFYVVRTFTDACILLFVFQDGFTPLLIASQCNHVKVIELLLGAGANVDLAKNVRQFEPIRTQGTFCTPMWYLMGVIHACKINISYLTIFCIKC